MCYGEDKIVDVAFRGLAWTLLDGMRFLALFKDSGPGHIWHKGNDLALLISTVQASNLGSEHVLGVAGGLTVTI